MKKLLILICAILLASASSDSDEFCTKPKKGKGQVTCSNTSLHEGDVLKIAGQTKPSKSVKSVTLFNITGTIDEKTLLFFPELQSLTIKESDIAGFDPTLNSIKNVFVHDSYFPQNVSFATCCKKLRKLGFYGNGDFDLDNGGLFKHLGRLEDLEIVHQNISHLSAGHFAGLSSLESLKIVDIGTEIVDENAFESLTNLKKLHLDVDALQTLGKNTFKPLKKLKELTVFGENLEPLTLDMFDQQRKLKKIGLPSNTWKTIDVGELKDTLPKLSNFGYEKDWTEEEDAEMMVFFQKIKKGLRKKH